MQATTCPRCRKTVRRCFELVDVEDAETATTQAVEVLLEVEATLAGTYVLRNLATGHVEQLAPMTIPGAQYPQHAC